MNLSVLENAILAQGELDGYEVMLNEPLGNISPSPSTRNHNSEPQVKQAVDLASIPAPPPKDEKWQSAATLAEFYAEIEKHPFYQRHAGEGRFTVPEFKPNAPYLLIFHSPSELTPESRTLLANIFTAISNRNASIFEPQAKKINLADCAISFLAKIPIKRILARELTALQKMLAKEIALSVGRPCSLLGICVPSLRCEQSIRNGVVWCSVIAGRAYPVPRHGNPQSGGVRNFLQAREFNWACEI